MPILPSQNTSKRLAIGENLIPFEHGVRLQSDLEYDRFVGILFFRGEALFVCTCMRGL